MHGKAFATAPYRPNGVASLWFLVLDKRVYRSPLIGGDFRTGSCHRDDLLYRLLKGCLELGMAADVPWELDPVPVDCLASAVTALAWLPESNGKNFHLQHPTPLALKDLLRNLIDKGTPFKIVSMDEWLEGIEAAPSNPLYEMRAFFTRRWGAEQLTYPELNEAGKRARPSTRITLETLNNHGVNRPTFEELIGTYGAALLKGGVS